MKVTTKSKNELAVVKATILMGTVETMSILGSMGERALRENGIEKLDPDKWYPHYLRAAIQDPPFQRYGKASLETFGFEMVFSEGVGKMWDDLLLKSNAIDKDLNMINLDDFLDTYMTCFAKMQKNLIRGQYDGYGGSVRKKDHLNYELMLATVAPLRHEAFHKTVMMAQILKYGGKNWVPSFTFLPNKSIEGSDWSNNYYEVIFEPRNTKKTNREILLEERYNARSILSALMFKDSEQQKAKLETLSSQLGKYIPPQIHQALFSGKYDTGITTKRKKLSIFFSDIKNFTSTSEGLQPEDLTKYLNEYFSEMTAIALDCGATIDKYIGDAMMVFFGDPESNGEREDARACVEMALRMQSRMSELQKKWENEGFADPFKVRMGINTGFCNVGNFGSDQRLTYTIIGGEVNVAQRLEAAADADGILMSYETYAFTQDLVDVEQKDTIPMKGINREIKIFSVLGRRERGTGEKLTGHQKHEQSRSNIKHNELDRDMSDRVNNLESKVHVLTEHLKKTSKKVDDILALMER